MSEKEEDISNIETEEISEEGPLEDINIEETIGEDE
jgi:hypothetical protein